MWWRLALFPVVFLCAALGVACSWLVGEDDWEEPPEPLPFEVTQRSNHDNNA